MDKFPGTVAVPIRQMKDIDQHLSWDNGPVSIKFKDFKKKKKKEAKQGSGHWNKVLRVALLGFSSHASLEGHRAFFVC